MEEFWKRFDQFSAQLQQLAGTAWDNLLLYKQVESIGHLTIGGVVLGLCLLFVYLGLKTYKGIMIPKPQAPEALPEYTGTDLAELKRYYNNYYERHYYRGPSDPELSAKHMILTILSGICALIFGIWACTELLYLWNWIGAFCPEARLFHALIQALALAAATS